MFISPLRMHLCLLAIAIGGCSLYQSEASKCLESSGIDIYRVISSGGIPSAYCGLTQAQKVPANSSFESCWLLNSDTITSPSYRIHHDKQKYFMVAEKPLSETIKTQCLTTALDTEPSDDFVRYNFQAFLNQPKDSQQ